MSEGSGNVGGAGSTRVGGAHIDLTLKGAEQVKAGMVDAAKVAKESGAVAGKAIEESAKTADSATQRLTDNLTKRLATITGLMYAARKAISLGEEIGTAIFVDGAEEAQNFAEALKFDGVKENLARVREEIEKTSATLAAVSAPFEVTDTLFSDIWDRVTGLAEKSREKLEALQAQAKGLQEVLNAQTNTTRDAEKQRRSESLKDELENARIANADGIAKIDMEHEYRLKKLNERKEKEIEANKEIVDALIAEEERRWKIAEQAAMEAGRKAAKAFEDAINSAFESIKDSIQNGAFGITSAGGDMSAVLSVLNRIDRKTEKR